MSEPTRLVSTHIGTNGHTTARVTMSPTSNKVRAEITAPPDQAIPVVFVPGIMGSPLLTSNAEAGRLLGENNRWAWFPDDGVGWVAGFTAKRGYRHLSPTERKLLLDPDTTRPVSSPEDADREVVSEHITTLPLQEALSRGWGSVMISSYGGILNFLEAQLRFIITSKGRCIRGCKVRCRTTQRCGGSSMAIKYSQRRCCGRLPSFVIPSMQWATTGCRPTAKPPTIWRENRSHH